MHGFLPYVAYISLSRVVPTSIFIVILGLLLLFRAGFWQQQLYVTEHTILYV